MDYEMIELAVEDRVATITMNRPDRMNAYVWRMGAEIDDAMAACDEDDGVRAVILTGAGRAFCAGADLAGGGDTFSGNGGERRPPASARRGLSPWQVRKPVVAAVNGHAIGVGLTMAMQCDVRYVAEDAKLSFAFVRRGVIPELGSHVIVPAVAGLSNAADLMLSGRTFLGSEAASLGLASRALPADKVLAAAREWARDVATNTAPASVAISKRLLWQGVPVSEMQKLEHPLFAWCGQQADAKEGVVSFIEKRAPVWQLSPTDLPSWPEG